jgi:hypothetical protein
MYTILVTPNGEFSPDKTATVFRWLARKRFPVASVSIEPGSGRKRNMVLRIRIDGDYAKAAELAAHIAELLHIDGEDSIRIDKDSGNSGVTAWKETLREAMDRQGLEAARLASSFNEAVTECARHGVTLPEFKGDLTTRIRKWRAVSQTQIPSTPEELALLVIALERAGAWDNEDDVVREGSLAILESIRPTARQARLRMEERCEGLAKA